MVQYREQSQYSIITLSGSQHLKLRFTILYTYNLFHTLHKLYLIFWKEYLWNRIIRLKHWYQQYEYIAIQK